MKVFEYHFEKIKFIFKEKVEISNFIAENSKVNVRNSNLMLDFSTVTLIRFYFWNF